MDLRGITLTGLRALAKHLPLRTLVGQSGPYLDRYVLAKMADGSDLYLHHFLTPDEDPAFHCHPWDGTGYVLHGGFLDERLDDGLATNGPEAATVPLVDRVTRRWLRTGDSHEVKTDTYHRVGAVEPETWTLFVTGPKKATWYFLELETGVKTPWRDRIRARGLTVEE